MAEALKKAVEALHNTLLLGDVAALEKMFIKTAAHQASPSQLVNEIDEQGFAALHRVVRSPDQMPLLAALLKVPGIQVDMVGEDKETPLFMAVHNNNIPAATALVAAGARVNVACGLSAQRSETPLHVAVKFGYEEMTAFLIHHKAEINARDGNRATPLIAAARTNRPTLLYQLLSAGANAAVQDMDGKDALYVASELRHMHCVTLLKVERKWLNDAMSQVRTEMKMEKPPLHTSEQLLVMAEKKRQLEAEHDKAIAELNTNSKSKKQPASPATATPTAATAKPASPAAAAKPAAAAAASSTPATPSTPSTATFSKENKIPAPPPSSLAKNKQPAAQEVGAAAAAAADAQRQQQQDVHRVEPMATRTHDPLTGKKLPPCKTLEEVGYDEPPRIPAHLVKKLPEQNFGGTVMVVGTGVPDMEKPRAPPMLFVNSFNTEESAYR